MLEKNPGTRQEVHEEATCSFPVCRALTMGSDKTGTADANKVGENTARAAGGTVQVNGSCEARNSGS